MSRRFTSALIASACALPTLLTPSGTPAAAGTGSHATTARAAVTARTAATARTAVTARTAATPCVRQGRAVYPVDYHWKNAFGMRLGGGSISVDTSPALWGGQIAPGSTFTLTLAHRTAQWPFLVSRYTTTWDLSSLLAYADVVGQSGTGSIVGSVLSIPSQGTKTDPSPKVVTFQVRQGTAGNAMTIRPTGISSVLAAPGQLGNNTPAPPIQIAGGQSISPTRAADDTATTAPGTAVRVPVLANDTAASPTITGLGLPGNGTATISGGAVVYTPAPGFTGTDSFIYAITTACGTSTATVTVTIPCTYTPVDLVNGSFEAPPVATINSAVPDASSDPAVGWRTTATDNRLEFWRSGQTGGGSIAVPAADGQQFAELNATQVSTLYQDLPTVPGTRMTWSLYHRGRQGTDVMRVLIGAPGATVTQVPTGAASPDISDGNTAWGYYTGVYVVPPGQTTTRFAFESVSAAGGNQGAGNLLDGVMFRTPTCP